MYDVPLYRGGTKLDASQISERGIPLTTKKSIAKKFATAKESFDTSVAGEILGKTPGQNIVEEYTLSLKARVATRNDIPDEIYKAYKKTNPVVNPEKGESLLGRWAKENGFDAIDYRTLGRTSAREAEIKILNPDVLVAQQPLFIKTKQSKL